MTDALAMPSKARRLAMKRNAAVISFFLTVLVSAAVAGPAWAATATTSSDPATERARSDYVPGELLVRFDTGRGARQGGGSRAAGTGRRARRRRAL